jgi:hypothetical protein
MSATYRQSTAARPDAATADPDNLLLHRQTRIRVEAEIVRDLNLDVSGLLNLKVGGAGVYPPLPQEFLGLAYKGMNGVDNWWPTSVGADRYRRGLYTFHKRTAAHPALQVFDWPTASATITGRTRSNTPLQAMTGLHNMIFAETAQAFARRIQVERPGAVRDQIAWAFRLAVARPPVDAELALFEGLYNDAKQAFDANAAEAMKAVGSYLPPGATAGAAAAWVATARIILNLDEFITRE